MLCVICGILTTVLLQKVAVHCVAGGGWCLSLSEACAEAKELQIKGLRAEVSLLKRQLGRKHNKEAPRPGHGAPAFSFWKSLMSRESLLLGEFQSQIALGAVEKALPAPFRLPQVLDFMSTPCSTKMESLCRASKELVRRHWKGVLDLSEVGKGQLWLRSDDASIFLGLLKQEKWQQARILRFPTRWVSREKARNGKPDILATDTIRIIGSFEQLEELDLLAYEGAAWDGVDSRVALFCRVLAGLRNLKSLRLEKACYTTMPAVAGLQVLHLRRYYSRGPDFDDFPAPPSLRELHMFRVHYCDSMCVGDSEGLKNLLQSCRDLRHLDVALCKAWSRDVFPVLAAHPKLETLVIFAGKPEDKDALVTGIEVLRSSQSLKQLRLVHPFAGVPFDKVRPGLEVKSESNTYEEVLNF